MPIWAWALMAVAAAAVVAALVVGGLLLWKRVVVDHLSRLVGKREEAKALRRVFDELVSGLQEGTPERRGRFADDPDALERHSLADLGERARALAEELNTMSMPHRLVSAAEALADAADILAEEADRAGEGSIGDESLEALASADLNRVALAFAHADEQIAPLVAHYGIDEKDVYVRGLYV